MAKMLPIGMTATALAILSATSAHSEGAKVGAPYPIDWRSSGIWREFAEWHAIGRRPGQ